jgi:hypothetical protein
MQSGELKRKASGRMAAPELKQQAESERSQTESSN